MKAKFRTQVEVEAEITRLIAAGDRWEEKRDKAAYESPEYWHCHDKAIGYYERARKLMPKGS